MFDLHNIQFVTARVTTEIRPLGMYPVDEHFLLIARPSWGVLAIFDADGSVMKGRKIHVETGRLMISGVESAQGLVDDIPLGVLTDVTVLEN